MAAQFHVAHSTTVRGAAILAAGPWDCAQGSTWRALTNCMSPTRWAPAPQDTLARAQAAAKAGRIDPLEGLKNDRVWLFSGGNDRTVARTEVDALAAFYRHWVAPGDLAYVTPPEPGHAMPSQDDPEANACPTSDPPYINRCGDLDAAGELLTSLLGPLAPKAATASGTLMSFDQTPYATQAGAAGLGRIGYAYIPAPCRAGGCRLHVVFHGCRQSADQIGERFAQKAGYNRWAESNRLVVLYPQTTPRYGWSPTWPPRWTYNPLACWDWWGYENGDATSRQAPQIRAIQGMVEQLEKTPPDNP